jgi:chemotaxis signal transduction protein
VTGVGTVGSLGATGATPATEEHLVCARVGEQLVAFPATCVREVLDRPEVTPVPYAPVGVLGALPLRGDVLCVLDPGPHLGLPSRTGAVAAVVVTVVAGRLLGVAVDEVTDVVTSTLRHAQGPAAALATVDVDGCLHQLLHPDELAEPHDQEDL